MEVVYYPDMYLTSELLLKQLLLCWGRVRTIVPPTQKEYIDEYLSGKISTETNSALDHYRDICDAAGDRIVDFLVIEDAERHRASEHMRKLLTRWNKDSHFYDALKIRSIDDLVGKEVEWYWFLHEKLERPLVELMLREQLVVNWSPGEIVGLQEVGKAYMSVIASQLQRSRNIRLITDDEYYLAAKGPVVLSAAHRAPRRSYELVSIAIPQVFFAKKVLQRLSWRQIISIRQDLLPFAASFYGEVERYQREINDLAAAGRDEEAFAKFCEFCERVAASFRPFAKEFGKILRFASPETVGLLNGVLLPAAKLANGNPELAKICDVVALASTVGTYAVSGLRRTIGFEYLENLGRALDLARMKNAVTSLVPKTLRANISS